MRFGFCSWFAWQGCRQPRKAVRCLRYSAPAHLMDTGNAKSHYPFCVNKKRGVPIRSESFVLDALAGVLAFKAGSISFL